MVREVLAVCLAVFAGACATGAVSDDTVVDSGHGSDGGGGVDSGGGVDGGGGNDGSVKDASSDSSQSFTVGGNVNGLTGTLLLQNNGADDLSLSADGAFKFSQALSNGAPYAVTVKTQPAGEACTVTGASGNIAGANVTNVAVACASNAFTIGGTVNGLVKGETLVLQDNGGDNLTLTDSGTFAFATKVQTNNPYAVSVLTQPTSGNCAVQSGSGTVASADITSVIIACTGSKTFAYTGSMDTFVVPGGITQVKLEAWGAQGNLNALSITGGLGGYATGMLTVTSGQSLYVFVGGGNTTAIAGGFNGGGSAAVHPCTTAAGGGGGGASDVRSGGQTLADRVLVGAGGGGAAGNRVGTCGRGGGGGGGGGYYGGGGGAGWPSTSTTVPTGGTQSAGGGAGTSTYSTSDNGQPGTLGVGGAGGTEQSSNQAGSNTGATGSSGGGTTGSDGTYSGNYTGQSGAGGSSYTGGVTSGTTTSGTRSGAGQVTISW